MSFGKPSRLGKFYPGRSDDTPVNHMLLFRQQIDAETKLFEQMQDHRREEVVRVANEKAARKYAIEHAAELAEREAELNNTFATESKLTRRVHKEKRKHRKQEKQLRKVRAERFKAEKVAARERLKLAEMKSKLDRYESLLREKVGGRDGIGKRHKRAPKKPESGFLDQLEKEERDAEAVRAIKKPHVSPPRHSARQHLAMLSARNQGLVSPIKAGTVRASPMRIRQQARDDLAGPTDTHSFEQDLFGTAPSGGATKLHVQPGVAYHRDRSRSNRPSPAMLPRQRGAARGAGSVAEAGTYGTIAMPAVSGPREPSAGDLDAWKHVQKISSLH